MLCFEFTTQYGLYIFLGFKVVYIVAAENWNGNDSMGWDGMGMGMGTRKSFPHTSMRSHQGCTCTLPCRANKKLGVVSYRENL